MLTLLYVKCEKDDDHWQRKVCNDLGKDTRRQSIMLAPALKVTDQTFRQKSIQRHLASNDALVTSSDALVTSSDALVTSSDALVTSSDARY